MIDTSKTYTSKKHGKLRIVEYISCTSVVIEFIDTGYRKTVTAGNINRGEIRDKLAPSVCSIGFIGDGEHKASNNNITNPAYAIWYGMLHRCYTSSGLRKSPSYYDCTVCVEWHSFQSFADWFHKNYIPGAQLDKDIKIKGNREYSPEACSFVTAKENSIESNAKHYRFISPEGELVEIYNLNEFAIKKGLAPSSMFCVHYGKMNNHRGWSKAAF
tara:strand:- start:4525 stop:5169 length:645 start_codon:yes stop_codon:yes gene_type:complete